MTAAERLAHIWPKVERAKQHVTELERACHAFLNTNPYVVGTKQDPQTRKLIYYVASVQAPPASIATITGDVLQNLMSALDHLAYQLVCVGMGSDGPFYHVYFPVADSATEYQIENSRKVKGMRPEAIRAIDAIKPYRGGNDPLWRLYKLNIVDKHRTIITVGSAFRSVDIGSHVHELLSALLPAGGATLPAISLGLRPADRLFPLKAGAELFIDAPNAKVNDKMAFRFEIAFGEPKIIEGEPLVETLHQFTDLVSKIIPGFEPLLV